MAMAAPIAKWSHSVESAEEIPAVLERAFATALGDRPGPVLIDIPMDVQRATIMVEPPRKVTLPEVKTADPSDVKELLGRLAEGRRPLILAGNGLRASGAERLFREFLQNVRVPVVHSLLAVDLLPYAHPLRVGMIGSYGNRWANLAIGGASISSWFWGAASMSGRLVPRPTRSARADDLPRRLRGGRDQQPGHRLPRDPGRPSWLPRCREPGPGQSPDRIPRHLARLDRRRPTRLARHRRAGRRAGDQSEPTDPRAVRRSGAASAFVADVGQHQMWAAQSLELGPDQRFLTSGGMGAMGFALPAAIGAAYACPGRPVVMIAGDGGFQLNLQELQTVARGRLPIKMIIVNNQCHGMVRQFQQSYFEERYQSTYWGYSAPDFAALARGYGIDGHGVHDRHGLQAALDVLCATRAAPALLDVRVDTFANAYPKHAFGRPISEMEPFAMPVSMEST